MSRPSLDYNNSERRWAQRYANRRRSEKAYRERHYSEASSLLCVVNIDVPENIERRESHEPCFKCGDRDGCRHRPWLLP